MPLELLWKLTILASKISPSHLTRQRRAILGGPPAVIAGGRDLQEAGHAGDLEV